MGKTLTEKLIAAHLVSGSMEPGAEVALRIDQTLTQDATGTMAYLEFESTYELMQKLQEKFSKKKGNNDKQEGSM